MQIQCVTLRLNLTEKKWRENQKQPHTGEKTYMANQCAQPHQYFEEGNQDHTRNNLIPFNQYKQRTQAIPEQ